jgi:hypothetical protein
MSAGGLPSACWGCGATAAGLRKRAKPVRTWQLSEQAAAALVVQLALAVGGLLPGHAATHSLNVFCNSCVRWNNGQLLVDEAARQAALARLERRSRNAQGLTRTAAVRSYHSV